MSQTFPKPKRSQAPAGLLRHPRSERSLSGMAGVDSKLEQKLREEVLSQLKKVTSANAPNLFEMMQSPQGYEQVEQMVINKVLHDQMVPAAVIPLLETELEMV